MIAGFFRLKDRLSRRPGFAIDPLPVHLWKRTKEVFRLLLSWARFIKEMEEIWLQTRPRSEREKRAFEEIQRIQGEIWRSLKIAEWQQVYTDAKAALPAKARALLDPFEELSSRMLLSRQDPETLPPLRIGRGTREELVGSTARTPQRGLDEHEGPGMAGDLYWVEKQGSFRTACLLCQVRRLQQSGGIFPPGAKRFLVEDVGKPPWEEILEHPAPEAGCELLAGTPPDDRVCSQRHRIIS
jgi:hypothetical protein